MCRVPRSFTFDFDSNDEICKGTLMPGFPFRSCNNIPTCAPCRRLRRGRFQSLLISQFYSSNIIDYHLLLLVSEPRVCVEKTHEGTHCRRSHRKRFQCRGRSMREWRRQAGHGSRTGMVINNNIKIKYVLVRVVSVWGKHLEMVS